MRSPRQTPTGISPRVDVVFGTLFADERHKRLLIDFLNAVLRPRVPIVAVELRSPFRLPDFEGDRGTEVDVLAEDAEGTRYQVEMQSWNHVALKARMLHNWAELFGGQLVKGDDYGKLQPVLSIWILDDNVLRSTRSFHHRFGVWDPDQKVQLSPMLAIHTLELEKWRRLPSSDNRALTRWMRFFSDGERWVDVPADINDEIMEEAMAVLDDFQADPKLHPLYRKRMDLLRVARGEVVARERLEKGLAEAAVTNTQLTEELQAARGRFQEEAEARNRAEAQAQAAEAQAQAAEAQAQAAEAQAQTAREELERMRRLLRAAGLSTGEPEPG